MFDLYECYKSDMPAETYIIKMQGANSALKDAESKSDWIEIKVSNKNLEILSQYKDLIAGICHYD